MGFTGFPPDAVLRKVLYAMALPFFAFDFMRAPVAQALLPVPGLTDNLQGAQAGVPVLPQLRLFRKRSFLPVGNYATINLTTYLGSS
jgi:hypothetical protein